MTRHPYFFGSLLAVMLVAVMLGLLSAACDYRPIDPYFSFNTVHTLHFTVPAGNTGQTALAYHEPISIKKDYTDNYSAPELLKTSLATRIALHPTSPALVPSDFVYARLLIGLDTVTFDTLESPFSDPYVLQPTNKNVVQWLRDTAFDGRFEYKLRRAPASDAPIDLDITFVHTGTHIGWDLTQ